MAKRAQPTASREFTTYILELKNGDTRKVTIPANYKLTFGSVIPFSAKGAGNSEAALRFYEGTKDNLRGVMMDVRSFRLEGIGILEKRTTTQRKTMRKNTPQGSKDYVVEAKVSQWVNPDAEESESGEAPNEFLSLTDDSGDAKPFSF